MKPNKANDFHDAAQKLNVNQFWHAVTCGVAVVKYRYSGRKVCCKKKWTRVFKQSIVTNNKIMSAFFKNSRAQLIF